MRQSNCACVHEKKNKRDLLGRKSFRPTPDVRFIKFPTALMLLGCPPRDNDEHVCDHRNDMQFSVPAALIGRTAFLHGKIEKRTHSKQTFSHGHLKHHVTLKTLDMRHDSLTPKSRKHTYAFVSTHVMRHPDTNVDDCHSPETCNVVKWLIHVHAVFHDKKVHLPPPLFNTLTRFKYARTCNQKRRNSLHGLHV